MISLILLFLVIWTIGSGLWLFYNIGSTKLGDRAIDYIMCVPIVAFIAIVNVILWISTKMGLKHV